MSPSSAALQPSPGPPLRGSLGHGTSTLRPGRVGQPLCVLSSEPGCSLAAKQGSEHLLPRAARVTLPANTVPAGKAPVCLHAGRADEMSGQWTQLAPLHAQTHPWHP